MIDVYSSFFALWFGVCDYVLLIEGDNYHGPTMVMLYASGAITSHEASPCKITHVNPLVNITSVCPIVLRNPCNNVIHNSSFCWKGRDQLKTHHLLHHVAPKRWLVIEQGLLAELIFFLSSLEVLRFYLSAYIFNALSCIIVPVARITFSG